jgi:hypothetical protein
MFYTGLDPRTMQPVFVPRTPHDKAMQRALLQYKKPQNRKLVLEALRLAGREDLIGYGKNCLVAPEMTPYRDRPQRRAEGTSERAPGRERKGPGGAEKYQTGITEKHPTARRGSTAYGVVLDKGKPAQPARPKQRAKKSEKWAKAKKK